jgi:hypothetical protein
MCCKIELSYLRFINDELPTVVVIVVIKGKDKSKFVPVLNQVPLHKEALGEWRYGFTRS